MDTKYRLVLSPQFFQELDEVFSYISKNLDAPKAAAALMKQIQDSIQLTQGNPNLYPLCPEPLGSLGMRKIVVNNYIIIYTPDEKKRAVLVLRIFYGAQDYIKSFFR